MRYRPAAFAAAILVLFGLPPATAGTEPPHLDARELLAGTQPTSVIANQAFVPGPAVRPARTPFNGDLLLSGAAMQTVPADLKFRAARGRDPGYFPAVPLSFMTVDDDLVPTTQDVIRAGFAPGGRSYWDVIVQPGRVWSEPADGGWSRAAFPFALVNSLEGETHNGLAIFLYRGHEVSALRYQIVQQTLPGNVETIFAASGSVPAHTGSGAPRDSRALALRYRAAQADAVPVRPWIELERQVGAPALAGFADGLPAKDTVLSGLDYHGAFYLHDCESTGGPLPWCERARFGVWSVTKSFIAEIALLRLAQKYGTDVFKAKIVDYVPAAGSYSSWANVTFEDCINMATGVGNGSTKRDPNDISDGYLDLTYNAWYDAPSRDDKVSALLRTAHVYPWGPGQVARYRDQDMYILGVAMDAFIKAREGQKAGLWSMLEHEVYEPIGIHFATASRTVEPLGEGIPLMGFGVYATIGELVKVGRLYHARVSRGAHRRSHRPPPVRLDHD
jgi:CubicO group peptidase (beta-lactamase class C family)